MRVYWRGRHWIIRPARVDEVETVLDDKFAAIYGNRSLVIYDNTVPPDLQIMAILHEIAHELYPEWSAEPNEKSKSELGIFERDVKAFLEACGVDLTPLLEK